MVSINTFIARVAAASALGYTLTGSFFMRRLLRDGLADMRWPGWGPLKNLLVTNG